MRALFRSDPLGVAAVVIAICAICAAAMASRPEQMAAPSTRPTMSSASAELDRCRSLGEAGGADAGCHAAWAESRRRFLGGSSGS